MKRIILYVLLGFTTVLQAQLKTYSYYRELKPVAADGYYDLTISSGVLDRNGFYRVYELTEKDTMEVPYITGSKFYDTYDKSYFKSLKIIDKSYEAGKASYATLILDTNLIYNSLYLNFSSYDFFKDITLEGSQDNKKWQTIIENEKMFDYYRSVSGHYYRNNIVFGDVSFKYIRVKMDDSNSEKIELLSASVPLVKEEASDGEILPYEMVRTEDKEKKQTILECSFKRKYLITCVQLNVQNDPPHFRRETNVNFWVNTNNSKNKWIDFGGGTVTSSSSNKIYLTHFDYEDEGFKSEKMRIIINNLDDKPLDKITPVIFTHEQSIKIKLKKDKRYVLAYGKEKDTSPQYDLAYFQNAIPPGLKKAELGSEVKIPQVEVVKPKPLFDNKKWIWVALIGCVVLIGIFAVKLLKK